MTARSALRAAGGAVVAAAFVTGATTVGAGPATAAPSCIAQGVHTFAHGEVGPTLSSYARAYAPLGAMVSFEATSDHGNCPPE